MGESGRLRGHVTTVRHRHAGAHASTDRSSDCGGVERPVVAHAVESGTGTIVSVRAHMIEDDQGRRVWRAGGVLHRMRGPAVEGAGIQEWWRHGLRHRLDGPAVIDVRWHEYHVLGRHVSFREISRLSGFHDAQMAVVETIGIDNDIDLLVTAAVLTQYLDGTVARIAVTLIGDGTPVTAAIAAAELFPDEQMRPYVMMSTSH